MNFITSQDPVTEMELKYCERCGGLWVRLQGNREVYCSNCRDQMAKIRPSSERQTNPRLPNPNPDDVHCQIKSLQGIAEAEVVL